VLRDADLVSAFLRRVSIVVQPADLPSDCVEILPTYRYWVLQSPGNAQYLAASIAIFSI
jgi:hypothetical protein